MKACLTFMVINRFKCKFFALTNFIIDVEMIFNIRNLIEANKKKRLKL